MVVDSRHHQHRVDLPAGECNRFWVARFGVNRRDLHDLFNCPIDGRNDFVGVYAGGEISLQNLRYFLFCLLVSVLRHRNFTGKTMRATTQPRLPPFNRRFTPIDRLGLFIFYQWYCFSR